MFSTTVSPPSAITGSYRGAATPGLQFWRPKIDESENFCVSWSLICKVPIFRHNNYIHTRFNDEPCATSVAIHVTDMASIEPRPQTKPALAQVQDWAVAYAECWSCMQRTAPSLQNMPNYNSDEPILLSLLTI